MWDESKARMEGNIGQGKGERRIGRQMKNGPVDRSMLT